MRCRGPRKTHSIRSAQGHHGKRPAIKLESVKLEDLGRGQAHTVDKDVTTIIDGAGSPKSIEGRIKQLRTQIEETTRTTTARNSRSGWPKLAGGVAIVKVGARDRNEYEGEEGARRGRASMPLARQSRKGIVPGGGVALFTGVDGVAESEARRRRTVRSHNRASRMRGAVVRSCAMRNRRRSGSREDHASQDVNFGFNASTEQYEESGGRRA